MLLKLLVRILLKKQKQFIRVVKLKDKTYVINVEEYKPINVVIDNYRRTAQEVPVQEQSLFNFSSQTGEKLHETCPNCWVKNKPYKCGFDKCPGYKLLATEAIEEK